MNAWEVPDADPAKWHSVMQQRVPPMLNFLFARFGYKAKVFEGYRSEQRQQWLWAQGRSAEDCAAAGVPEEFARPGQIVTNASSAATSAHGYTVTAPTSGVVTPGMAQEFSVTPAALAVDVIPDEEAHPFADEVFFDAFAGAMEQTVELFGLRHFYRKDGTCWDKPHVQAVEWDDATSGLRTG